MTPGYRALRESVARIDSSARGKIRVNGEDRARLIHAMTTNHVQGLKPGQGCYAFFLNDKGRILADTHVFCFTDHLWLDTEAVARERVFKHIDDYIIADDVTLEDVTDQYAGTSLEGPGLEQELRGFGLPWPVEPYGCEPIDGGFVTRFSITGAPGLAIFYAVTRQSDFDDRFATLPLADAADVEVVRLENGRARYGADFGESYLAQETQLARALHFQKGCYLGQEIVERVRSRGQVHRLLTPLRIEATEPPSPSTKVQANGKDAGEITSAAYSPAHAACVALGYIRRDFQIGHELRTADGARVEVTARVPSQEV